MPLTVEKGARVPEYWGQACKGVACGATRRAPAIAVKVGATGYDSLLEWEHSGVNHPGSMLVHQEWSTVTKSGADIMRGVHSADINHHGTFARFPHRHARDPRIDAAVADD